ncbi:hypothetical protein E2562_030817 [Oryza meyeriana var. granulata]|uniref:Uncharacterized protein n=1 Tax=Oryza meyeriana var. granulata TaxID=110450 RepID=A0A6G1D8H6_9ORYZ|nr:hypothetical protein E2562_030817 [Oryza meyeriana var. granulata]
MILPRLHLLLVLVSVLPLASVAAGGEGFCSAEPSASSECSGRPPLYWKVTNPTLAPAHLQDLPGFTRSVYKRDHALITPESHVFSPLPDWVNTLGAYLISPAIGAHFTMYLAKMHDGSKSALPPKGVERLIFVLQGSIALSLESGNTHSLLVDSYAYLPANMKHSVVSDELTTLVIFERRYTTIEDYHPDPVVGSTDKQPLLETPGEVFQLRKLLPTSLPYDFNIHIMDFQPGEYLNVKEVHYNQHGLLLLGGQGIYRLGDSWYPVQAGDTIWMAPFVPQWYAALGKTKTSDALDKHLEKAVAAAAAAASPSTSRGSAGGRDHQRLVVPSSASSMPKGRRSEGESESDSEASDVSGSDGEDTSWISWYCNLRGNEFFCEVDDDYIQDDFNLCGLSSQVPYYDYALDLILDIESSHGDMFTEEQNELVESAAEMLYGLIHARYILTSKGLAAMLEKYKNYDFGRCPRVYCCGQPCLPVGQSDIHRSSTVKIYCPKCEDIYYPRSKYQGNIDGAYFGTTFPHLFLMTYEHLKPQKPSQRYVPRVFGFKLHKP